MFICDTKQDVDDDFPMPKRKQTRKNSRQKQIDRITREWIRKQREKEILELSIQSPLPFNPYEYAALRSRAPSRFNTSDFVKKMEISKKKYLRKKLKKGNFCNVVRTEYESLSTTRVSTATA